MGIWSQIVSMFCPRPVRRSGETHDYRYRFWSHDYVITEIHDSGMRIEIFGWGHGIKVNDFLLLQNKRSPSGEARYQINSIEYCLTPSDMWFATASFSQRPIMRDTAQQKAASAAGE